MKIDGRRAEGFAQLLPYLHFSQDGEVLWLKDGSAAMTFELVPKNSMALTDEELEIVRSGLSSALNQLPEGAIAQLLLVREKTSEKTDIALNNWKENHESGNDS